MKKISLLVISVIFMFGVGIINVLAAVMPGSYSYSAFMLSPGGWSTATQVCGMGSDGRVTTNINSVGDLEFYGAGIILYYKANTTRGTMQVWIDGVLTEFSQVGTLDTCMTYTRLVVNGYHELQIKKNANDSLVINIEGIVIFGSLPTSTSTNTVTATGTVYTATSTNTVTLTPSMTNTAMDEGTPNDMATVIPPTPNWTATMYIYGQEYTPTMIYNFNCPTGSPVGWGTVTPSSLWNIFCLDCLPTSTGYSINTSSPKPTNTQNSATKTAVASITPVSPTSTCTPVPLVTITCASDGCIQDSPYEVHAVISKNKDWTYNTWDNYISVIGPGAGIQIYYEVYTIHEVTNNPSYSRTHTATLHYTHNTIWGTTYWSDSHLFSPSETYQFILGNLKGSFFTVAATTHGMGVNVKPNTGGSTHHEVVTGQIKLSVIPLIGTPNSFCNVVQPYDPGFEQPFIWINPSQKRCFTFYAINIKNFYVWFNNFMHWGIPGYQQQYATAAQFSVCFIPVWFGTFTLFHFTLSLDMAVALLVVAWIFRMYTNT